MKKGERNQPPTQAKKHSWMAQPLAFLSSPFPLPFPFLSLSLSLSFPFLFPFPFLSLSLSLSFPFPSPVPFHSLSLPFCSFPFPYSLRVRTELTRKQQFWERAPWFHKSLQPRNWSFGCSFKEWCILEGGWHHRALASMLDVALFDKDVAKWISNFSFVTGNALSHAARCMVGSVCGSSLLWILSTWRPTNSPIVAGTWAGAQFGAPNDDSLYLKLDPQNQISTVVWGPKENIEEA